MAWQKFTETGRSFKPKISIRGDVQFGLNTAAVKEFKLKDYKYAILFFDGDKKRIGIQLTNDKDEQGACRLRVRDDSKGAHISAKAYITKYNLDKLEKKDKRIDAYFDDNDKMIIANYK